MGIYNRIYEMVFQFIDFFKEQSMKIPYQLFGGLNEGVWTDYQSLFLEEVAKGSYRPRSFRLIPEQGVEKKIGR